jgi:hypothetical protein
MQKEGVDHNGNQKSNTIELKTTKDTSISNVISMV